MTKIIYRWCGGSEVAYWPGESYRDGGGHPRKKANLHWQSYGQGKLIKNFAPS
ncbi:MAG: hypothetical protein IJU40_00245 [Desulfovibrionaceae bacterium]|nr:hypothetical protein [Desulfovibrionaceae bacterium]